MRFWRPRARRYVKCAGLMKADAERKELKEGSTDSPHIERRGLYGRAAAGGKKPPGARPAAQPGAARARGARADACPQRSAAMRHVILPVYREVRKYAGKIGRVVKR